jgi:signal transduction histidine kinase
MKYYINLLIFVSFILQSLCIHANEDNEPIQLKVGVYDNYPKIFVNENGQPSGIFIDVLEAIALKEEYTIQYIEDDWHILYEMLISGEIDILPDMSYSTKRDSLFTLTTLPLLGSWLEVFTTDITEVNSILDIRGKKVGVLKGGIQEEYITNKIKQDFELDFEIFIFNSYSETAEALKSNIIDVIISGRFFYYSDLIREDIRPTGIVLRPADLYFAFTKNKHPEIVSCFDKNISILKNNSNSVYYKSLQKWLDKEQITGIPEHAKWIIGTLVIILIMFMLFIIMLNYRVKIKTQEIKLKNEELILSIKKAEESDHLKTVFLQNMSHEIRTPLNVTLGYLDLLNDKELNEESRKKYIDIIHRSGQRLLSTLNNIIEISKIEANQLDVNEAEVDIQNMMEFYCEFFNNQTQKKGVKINLAEHIKGEEAIIKTDKHLLDGILTNLLDNAVKFTKDGSIEIGNYIENDNIVFYVKDTGIGIPEHKQKIIFDSFIQAETKINRPYEGSGLGLSITKAYVEALKGKIWLESKTLKGSTFFFSIPYVKIEHDTSLGLKETEKPLELRSNFTILIAEDDELSFEYINRIINNKNITVVHAANGEEAVRIVRENANIALVLMDIKMPGIDGFEATQLIRLHNKTIPIIAQTAYALSGDKEKAISVGCNDYISKPISRSDLNRIIRKYLIIDKA